MSSAVEVIRDFIRAGANVSKSDDLFSDQVDLLDYGYLDSFGIVGLMEMVEQRFGVDLSDVDFYAKDHRTIQGITALVETRQGRKA